MTDDIAKWISRLPSFRAEQKLLKHFNKTKPTQQQTDEIVKSLLAPPSLLNRSSSTSQSETPDIESSTDPSALLLATLSRSTMIPWSVFYSPRLSLDSEPSLRAAIEIISNSKTFLLMARHYTPKDSHSSAYTTQSQNIAALHAHVLKSLLQQLNRGRLVRPVIEALTALVNVSNWESLDPAHRPLIFEGARKWHEGEHRSVVLGLYSALVGSGYEIEADVIQWTLELVSREDDGVGASLGFFQSLLFVDKLSAQMKSDLLEKGRI